jgi:hypothetical protein
MKYLCLVYEEGAAIEAREGTRPVDFPPGGGAGEAITLRLENGKVSFGDSAFAVAEKFLGGVMVLEARDLNHAIQLMSRLPRTRPGGWVQIRPIDEKVDGRDGGLR